MCSQQHNLRRSPVKPVQPWRNDCTSATRFTNASVEQVPGSLSAPKNLTRSLLRYPDLGNLKTRNILCYSTYKGVWTVEHNVLLHQLQAPL